MVGLPGLDVEMTRTEAWIDQEATALEFAERPRGLPSLCAKTQSDEAEGFNTFYKLLKPAVTVLKLYYSSGVRGGPPAEVRMGALTVCVSSRTFGIS